MATNISIPAGTRDFTPIQMLRRNYIFDTIRNVFKLYGYLPIETPSMENLSTLMGKYGEEGDKLLFKVLNSGDFLSKVSEELLTEKNSIKTTTKISDKGLRYDLTVPFARYVVQHRNEITNPFKRYQIQPVWRADRPQKGRYREFYQCDVDVIGSKSLLYEVELIDIIQNIFTQLGVNICIKLNNRKILSGIASYIGEADKIIDITVAMDKLDKIGLEAVNKELSEKGIHPDAIAKLQPIILLEGTNTEKLNVLKDILKDVEVGMTGIGEMEHILDLASNIGNNFNIDIDLTLARGLNYYTGAIFEVKAVDAVMGSICGGGRYDDLTSIFGLKDMSGVGVSFGADRIYDVMNDLNLFPEDVINSTEVLFVNFGAKEEKYCLQMAALLRKHRISCEVYPENSKMKKQMSYADDKKIPYVAIIGENEMQQGMITLKNMHSGVQELLCPHDLIKVIQDK